MIADNIESLLTAVARGDQRSFAALYDAMTAVVHGLTLRVVRDPTLAEEVTQEVFVEVWRKAPSFDARRGSAKGWIVTIAHRRAVDRVRREQSQRDRVARLATLSAPDATEFTEELEAAWNQSIVRDALGELSDAQRQAIELAYFGSLTYREVADVLATPIGTVKTRMRDGLHKLRRVLKDQR